MFHEQYLNFFNLVISGRKILLLHNFIWSLLSYIVVHGQNLLGCFVSRCATFINYLLIYVCQYV